MEYVVKNKESGVINHFFYEEGEKLPSDAILVPTGWLGIVGEPNEFYTDEGYRKPLEILILQGHVIDNRGVWYTSEKVEKNITELKEIPPDSWTRDKWNHVTDVLVDKVWVEDLNKKRYFNAFIKSEKAKKSLKETDKEIPRPLEEMFNVLYQDQKEKLSEYTIKKMNEKREKREEYIKEKIRLEKAFKDLK